MPEFGATAIPASAQPPEKLKWIKTEAAGVVVYSSSRAAKARNLLEAIEELNVVMSNFGTSVEDPSPPTVVLAFDRSTDIEPYLSSPSNKGITRMAEYGIDAHGTAMLLNASQAPEGVLPWVYRAQLGQDITRRFPELPLWARTGLTHFYATMQVERSGKVRLGRPDQRHLRRSRDYSWIPLEQFFRVARDSPLLSNGDTLAQFQAQAWVLSHYAMTGGGDDPRLGGHFYAALGGGLTAEEAIREIFDSTVAEFQGELGRYSRGMTLKYFSIQVADLPADNYEVTAVPRAELLLRLGQYLVRTVEPIPVEKAEGHLLPIVEDPQTHSRLQSR